jgi:hypothetical protein
MHNKYLIVLVFLVYKVVIFLHLPFIVGQKHAQIDKLNMSFILKKLKNKSLPFLTRVIHTILSA